MTKSSEKLVEINHLKKYFKVEKGFFCEMQPEDECLNLTFHMFQVEGKELVCIIEGMMELGDRLGMFSPTKETQEGEEGNRERKRS